MHVRFLVGLIIILINLVVESETVFAQSNQDPFDLQLGEEYSEYNKGRAGMSGRGKTNQSHHEASDSDGTWKTVLLYIPNRIVDFLDIFRVDIGVGPAVGGVMRLTKWGQAGYRDFYPGSVRIGLNGRRSPVFVEHRREAGLGTDYRPSSDRDVTPGEFGVGVDLLVAGAYIGVSADELIDFFGGIFCLDPSNDDF